MATPKINAVPLRTQPSRWIDCDLYKQVGDEVYDGYTYCEKCHHHEKYGYRSNYCPECGSRMENGGSIWQQK